VAKGGWDLAKTSFLASKLRLPGLCRVAMGVEREDFDLPYQRL